MSLKFQVQVTSGHVTRSQKRGTMSRLNFSYLYAPVPPTVFDRFLLNFQDAFSSPTCTTYRPFLYIADLSSTGSHDFVMLSVRKSIQMAHIPKILDIYALFHHFCASILLYVTIIDHKFYRLYKFLFVGCTYPSVGSNKVY